MGRIDQPGVTRLDGKMLTTKEGELARCYPQPPFHLAEDDQSIVIRLEDVVWAFLAHVERMRGRVQGIQFS